MARPAVKKTLRLEDDTWEEHPISVELAEKEFARGALRSAFRLKLFGLNNNSSEWVAKRYIKAIENEDKLYEDDIKVQVLSKAYADQYTKHGMPKAVDFVVPFLMILDGKKYCVEPFITGEYKKHSNNSGFVEVAEIRNTPHAFSHFSLVKSGYRVLICDIQGVNDLYTDPTVHTWTGTEFGDNNLGLRGMALFLYSHTCSPLCQKLGLPAFDLWGSDTPTQHRAPKLAMMRATTMTNSYTEIVNKMKETMAAASLSGQPANVGPRLVTPPNTFPQKPDLPARIHYELAKMHESGRLSVLDEMYKEEGPADAKHKAIDHNAAAFYHYQRAAIGGHVGAMLRVGAILQGRNAPAEFAAVKNPQLAAFYLSNAAARESRPALLACVEYYLAPGAPDWAKGADYIERLIASNGSSWASSSGPADPAAAATLTMSKLAVSPVQESFEGDAETWGWPSEFNSYEMQARLAEMFEKGGNGLASDMTRAGELYRSAGDEAMAQGKGKLANKYYAQAEVCESC